MLLYEMVKKKKIKKERPPRLFVTKKGRPYVIVKRKRIYIKPEKNMTQRQLVNVVINNFRKRSNRKKKGAVKPVTKQDILQKADYLSFLNHTFLNKKEDAEKIIGRIEEKIQKQKEGKTELLNALTDVQESNPAITHDRPDAIQYIPSEKNEIRADLIGKYNDYFNAYKEGWESEKKKHSKEEKKAKKWRPPLPPLPEKKIQKAKETKSKLDFNLTTPEGHLVRTTKLGGDELLRKHDELTSLTGQVSKLDEEKANLENKIVEEKDLEGKKQQRRELEKKVEKLTYIKLDMLRSLGFTGTRPQIIAKLSDEQLVILKEMKKKEADSLEQKNKFKQHLTNTLAKNALREEFGDLPEEVSAEIDKEIQESAPNRGLENLLEQDRIFLEEGKRDNITVRGDAPTVPPTFPTSVYEEFISDTNKEKKEGKKGDDEIIERTRADDDDDNDDDDINRTFFTPKGKPQGSGKIAGGLWSDQLERIMHRYKNFMGVYPIDKIKDIPVKDKMGFILNLSPSNEKGSHWVGVYIDTKKDKSIEYYDSFAREPPKEFMKNIKTVINKLNPDTYLKFKVNRVVQQSAKSNNCGIFSAKWLTDRFEGIPFKDCTKFNKVKEGEETANKLRKKYKAFGYI